MPAAALAVTLGVGAAAGASWSNREDDQPPDGKFVFMRILGSEADRGTRP